jgi:hypothetical protein
LSKIIGGENLRVTLSPSGVAGAIFSKEPPSSTQTNNTCAPSSPRFSAYKGVVLQSPSSLLLLGKQSISREFKTHPGLSLPLQTNSFFTSTFFLTKSQIYFKLDKKKLEQKYI